MAKIQEESKTPRKVACFLAVVLAFCLSQPLIYPVSFEEIAKGLEAIQSQRIKATLEFLASEHFKGRETGTAEARLTAAYIASIFQRNGLTPLAKENTSFLQEFELSQGLPREGSILEVQGQNGQISSLKLGQDFIPAPWGVASAVGHGEAVFAGYGINAPEYQYDDYSNLVVKGKVVVLLSKFPGHEKTSPFGQFSQRDYEDSMQKAIQAEKLGAVGVIVILPPTEEIPALHSSNFKKAKTYLASDVESIRIPSIFVSYKVGETMVQRKTDKAPETLTEFKKRIDDHLQPHSFIIGKRVHIKTVYERRRLVGQNILGMIPGADALLKDEFVILSAHHDHLGEGENHEIFFGADDNASGTTGLLELVEAFQHNSAKPKRSILFAAWGAEEIGLLGSKHYIQNPLAPLKKTVAMIQMDMIGRNEERSADSSKNIQEEKAEQNSNSLNLSGSPFSQDLKSLFDSTNQKVGLELKFRFDFGEENLIKRSDHWSFIREGIPSLLLFTGFHPDYHKPTDTADKINFQKMAKILKLIYLAIWELADAKQLPRFSNEPFNHKINSYNNPP